MNARRISPLPGPSLSRRRFIQGAAAAGALTFCALAAAHGACRAQPRAGSKRH